MLSVLLNPFFVEGPKMCIYLIFISFWNYWKYLGLEVYICNSITKLIYESIIWVLKVLNMYIELRLSFILKSNLLWIFKVVLIVITLILWRSFSLFIQIKECVCIKCLSTRQLFHYKQLHINLQARHFYG